ncbi:MAG: amidohydrolase family protein [bacterium]|nr:amidohydrolase family protein [bacterium]
MPRPRTTTILALIVLLWGCVTEPKQADVSIENVHVIDAAHELRPDQRVVVNGGRILSVAPMAEPAPAAKRTYDAGGRYLIPGLWDMHVHFLYDESLTEKMPALFLKHGITSVRDTGGELDRLAALRARLREDPDPEPRIFISGPLLDGKFVVYDGSDPGRPKLGTGVPDIDAARRSVLALEAGGADFIKIYELVHPDVFEALASEARAQGLPIASHVPLMMTADTAGPMVDSMEHLRNIELACASNWASLLEVRQSRIRSFVEGRGYDLRRELHAEQRLPAIADHDEARCNTVLDALTSTTQVPTLRLNTLAMIRPFERLDWAPALAELPEDVQQRWLPFTAQVSAAAATMDHTFAKWSLSLISRLEDRGVPIGAGTDTPIGLAIPGYSLHTELELLVRSGMTPLEALHAATVQPARFFGMEDELGLIRPGMLADLVLLDANPLDDIENTRRIRRVMSRGEWAFGSVEEPQR